MHGQIRISQLFSTPQSQHKNAWRTQHTMSAEGWMQLRFLSPRVGRHHKNSHITRQSYTFCMRRAAVITLNCFTTDSGTALHKMRTAKVDDDVGIAACGIFAKAASKHFRNILGTRSMEILLVHHWKRSHEERSGYIPFRRLIIHEYAWGRKVFIASLQSCRTKVMEFWQERQYSTLQFITLKRALHIRFIFCGIFKFHHHACRR